MQLQTLTLMLLSYRHFEYFLNGSIWETNCLQGIPIGRQFSGFYNAINSFHKMPSVMDMEEKHRIHTHFGQRNDTCNFTLKRLQCYVDYKPSINFTISVKEFNVMYFLNQLFAVLSLSDHIPEPAILFLASRFATELILYCTASHLCHPSPDSCLSIYLQRTSGGGPVCTCSYIFQLLYFGAVICCPSCHQQEQRSTFCCVQIQ